jgi:hypothetical protein
MPATISSRTATLVSAIVTASMPPSRCVRTAADTGVPVEFFDNAEQGPLAYKRFRKQRGHAKERGIEWQLTFAEWWGIWRESGLWAERGCARGGNAVMARFGDKGPYRVGNVRILSLAGNFAESREVLAGVQRRQPKKPFRPPILAGAGRGWTRLKGNLKKPYMVKVAGKYVGTFATEVEAETAYSEAAAIHVRTAWPEARTERTGRKPQIQKPVADRAGSVYLQDIAAGMTTTQIAEKHGKAGRSSIRMALMAAGLPTCHKEYLRQLGEA